MKRVQELVERFGMTEHPEGGFYKETFRSAQLQENRSILSSIYYLLYGNHVSNLHVIDADEAWYHHEGGDLTIHTFHPKTGYKALILGNSEFAEPFHIVEGGTIFGSSLSSADNYALVSCAVAPAFLFEHFKLTSRTELLNAYPDQKEIILKLTRDEEPA